MFDTFIVQPIFNLLFVIYSLIPGGDFGVALVIFTILVRFLMWPLVKKQLHQVKAMRKMQPELVKIKQLTKGDKRQESLMMMELYKKHDINPFQSIILLFIQLPIFIALYQVIQIFITHNSDKISSFTYGFLKDIGPIHNLIANPNNFNEKMLGFLDLTKHAIVSNPFTIDYFVLALAIGAAVTQYIMSKQTTPAPTNGKKLRDIMNEAADGKQADQSEMNAVVMSNMTKFLPFMMFFIMINLPGALVLYYTVSNVVAVFQQGRILKEDSEEMIEIADRATDQNQNKKATAKAREKQATEATITRIVAKDTAPRKSNKKEKS
ncbi:MAG: YidC/Oxa1 family membrane protein insertase [Candidatus Saccharibacteria bacterium]